MLQRYEIGRNYQTNRLSIKEFAVLEKKSNKHHDYKPVKEDYSLIHQVSYDGEIIRAAISQGQNKLISELRSGEFFPIYPCIELIAESVASLFNGNTDLFSEVLFDDCTLLSTYDEE